MKKRKCKWQNSDATNKRLRNLKKNGEKEEKKR